MNSRFLDTLIHQQENNRKFWILHLENVRKRSHDAVFQEIMLVFRSGEHHFFGIALHSCNKSKTVIKN